MKKLLLLEFVLSCDIACGMAIVQEYMEKWSCMTKVVPTTPENLSRTIADVTLYRDFALAQTAEDTVHPSLKLSQDDSMTFEEAKVRWEEVVVYFNDALTHYNSGDTVKGDTILNSGFFWGCAMFSETALKKHKNHANGEDFITVFSNQITAVQGVPGNPTQYFQHLTED